jgi:cation transport regulator ChaB
MEPNPEIVSKSKSKRKIIEIIVVEEDDETLVPAPVIPAPIPIAQKKLLTEDTGKSFEMAICMALGIAYDGPYKYSMDLPNKLKERLETHLPVLFPHKLVHTAKKGARYDYTGVDDQEKHLSAKTTKKGVGKVAPQVIGQSQPKKFCDIMGIEYTDNDDLKQYIQENITQILPIMINYTFDCPNIYYNQEKNRIRFISQKNSIDWNKFTYKWTCNHLCWNNSSTVKVVINGREIPLVEFQFHTKSRTNMVIRWCYDNLLTICEDSFEITDI